MKLPVVIKNIITKEISHEKLNIIKYKEEYKRLESKIIEIKKLLVVIQGDDFYEIRDRYTEELKKLRGKLNHVKSLISKTRNKISDYQSWIDKNNSD